MYDVNFHSTIFTNTHTFLTNWTLFIDKNNIRKHLILILKRITSFNVRWTLATRSLKGSDEPLNA